MTIPHVSINCKRIFLSYKPYFFLRHIFLYLVGLPGSETSSHLLFSTINTILDGGWTNSVQPTLLLAE